MSKLKTEPIVWYVEMKSFWDNKKSRWRQTSVGKYLTLISTPNYNSSYAEVLIDDFVIPYFDIDHLDPSLKINDVIEKIKQSFISYFNCNTKKLVVTITKNKSKPSYHIYFKGQNIKYYVRKKDLKKFVRDFNKHFDCKGSVLGSDNELLDPLVYGSSQIFRSINQPKPSTHKALGDISTSHEVIQGEVEDTIIQNFSIYKDILIEPIILFE